MCVNMRRMTLPSGLSAEVPCHCCWQCRADRVRNWVGKCIAESQTSAAVDFVTLTYCDVDSPAAKWVKEPVSKERTKALDYGDIQKYLKRIRKAGHSVRYVCAGEYGTRKGRSHWHIILFWQKARPKRRVLHGNEWQDEFWHHGHVNYAPFDEGAAKYVCKYLLKWENDQEPERKTHFRYSARPGIGFNWISHVWAQRHVEQGLSPQSAKYSFPNIMRAGVRVQFKMSPHCQLRFVQDFERRWKEQRGGHPPPSSFCEKILDKLAPRICSDALERRVYVKFPYIKPPNGEKVLFDEKLNVYYFDCGGFRVLRYYWSFDEKGRRSWERDIVTPSAGARSSADWAPETRERYAQASQSKSWRAPPDHTAARSTKLGAMRLHAPLSGSAA